MTELRRHPQQMTEADMDRLLEGGSVQRKPEFDQLGAHLRSVKSALEATPPADVRSAHLAQMAALLDRTRRPEAAPTRETLMSRIYDRTLGTFRRRAYALSTAMVIASGSMAAAGILPDPAQDALSDAAAKVGFSLPAGGEEDATADAPSADSLPEEASDVAVAVLSVIENRDDYANGHEFGQAVAAAAREANGSAGAGKPEDAGSQADGFKPADPGSRQGTGGSAGAGKPDGVGEGSGAGDAGEGAVPESAGPGTGTSAAEEGQSLRPGD